MLGIDVNAWFQIIGHILQKELPEASEGKEPSGQPLSLEDRKVWPWWKVRCTYMKNFFKSC